MDIWSAWLDAIRQILEALSTDLGLGLGLAIVLGTLLLRIVLLPIALPIAYRGCIRQKKLLKLQPRLQELKDAFGSKPDLYMQKTIALYKKNDLALFDGKGIVGALAQLPVFLGMFHMLRNVGDGVRFLWVSNLLRPDMLLAVVAGLTTVLMMAVNPDLPEQMRVLMIVVPSIIAILAALQFSSALAVYWATSNTFSAAQTVLLHAFVRRRIQSGAIKL